MSEKDEIAKLTKDAALAKAEAALKEKRADGPDAFAEVIGKALAKALTDAGLGPKAAKDVAEEQTKANAKRAKLKAATLKEGTGADQVALYLIPEGGQMFYRLGVSTPPGSVVRLPIAEDPSVTWLPVKKKVAEDAEFAAVEPAPETKGGDKRSVI